MNIDPIVDEVRNTGKIISEKCSNDVHKFANFIRKNEEKNKAKGWVYVSNKKDKILK